jgi:hypothetical protein
MIVCDDHFLNDESMLKTMLRVFERRIIWIFRLKSISWVVFSLSFKRETRNVYVCACVCLFVCSKKNANKKRCFRKNLYFVEFRNFYLLKSILELIIRSIVNIKREKSLFRWQNSKIRIYIYASSYKSSFFLLYSFRSQIILFYFNFLCCFNFLNSLNSILVSSFVVLFRHQHDRFK